jgi:hypothetical protein
MKISRPSATLASVWMMGGRSWPVWGVNFKIYTGNNRHMNYLPVSFGFRW